MMRALGLSLLVLLTACGSRAIPAHSLPKAAVATPPHGVRAEVPGHGFSAEFPTAPLLETASGEHPITQLVSKGAQSYFLFTVSMAGKDRPKDADWYEAVRNNLKLEKQGTFELGSFQGVELGGTLKKQQTVARLLAVGDTLLVAQVEAKPGELDTAAAQRFFSSVSVTMPWRIYASPVARFSVMVPAHAIELDRTAELFKTDGRASSRCFYVGGREKLSYWANAQQIIDRDQRVSDEQILDFAIQGMQQDGLEVTFQGPVQVPGLRGREFLGKQGLDVMRGRILVGDDFVYVLMVGAKGEQSLRDPAITRFYDSLVWY